MLKSLLRHLGFEVRRTAPRRGADPGTQDRPIGVIKSFLEDIKSRGFSPRGIMDVGANRGDWTRLALSVFPGTPIIMIEPQDEMECSLVQLVKEMPFCHYVKAGAGS